MPSGVDLHLSGAGPVNLVFTKWLRPTCRGKKYAIFSFKSPNLHQAPVSLVRCASSVSSVLPFLLPSHGYHLYEAFARGPGSSEEGVSSLRRPTDRPPCRRLIIYCCGHGRRAQHNTHTPRPLSLLDCLVLRGRGRSCLLKKAVIRSKVSIGCGLDRSSSVYTGNGL